MRAAAAATDDQQDTAAGNGRLQDALESTDAQSYTSASSAAAALPQAGGHNVVLTGEKQHAGSHCGKTLPSPDRHVEASSTNYDINVKADSGSVADKTADSGNGYDADSALDFPAEQHACHRCDMSFENRHFLEHT